MAKPTLSGTPTSFLVTPAQVLYNGVDLGFVSGIKVKGKHETTEVKTDQLGKSIANHYHVGDTMQVEMMFDQISAAQFKKAFPFATLVGTYPNQRVSWGQPLGGDFYSIAQELIIRPTVDDTAYKLRNFTFWKATPLGDAEIEYTPDKKAQIKVTFFCYADLTKNNGEWYGYFGDFAAGTLTPASQTNSFAGSGGGTIGSFILNNTFTKTETWTITCIATAPAGGIFSVAGSVTGARGNATVGSSYLSNNITPGNSELGFTISDGSPDFSLGDTFTVNTVAASYT